jgi:hypothetical protein
LLHHWLTPESPLYWLTWLLQITTICLSPMWLILWLQRSKQRT